MAKISVIVPVYNAEKYLNRCVDSILNQTFSDFELILIDDGSTDSSGKICDEYAENDSRIIVKHTPNGGVCYARNIALDMITGEYVSFCDCDDTYCPDLLENALQEIIKNNSDCVSYSFYEIHEDGMKCISKRKNNGLYTFPTAQAHIDYLVNSFLNYGQGWSACHHLLKSNLIQNNNIRFCTSCNNFAEDLCFIFEYMLYAKSVFCLDKAEYNYYIHSGSMMDKSKNVVKLNELNEVTKYLYPKYNAVFSEQKETFSIVFFLFMYNQYSKIINGSKIGTLPKEIEKINDKSWYKKNTKLIKKRKRVFVHYYGEQNTKRILLFTRYCRHRNFNLYKIQSGIFYKLNKVS